MPNKLGTDTLKDFVAQYYKGAGWKCDEAIQGMMEADDFYGCEIVQVKTPTLYQGRFVLVGDAGYAPGPTDTGTSLAISDAYILAGGIGKHRRDLAAGLKGYEKQMRPLINEMQKISPLVLMMFAPQDGLGTVVAELDIRIHLLEQDSVGFREVLRGSAAHSDDYKVPEYEWEA
jgi:flavin-dependent dehydrogenase